MKGTLTYMHLVPQNEFICGWGSSILVDHVIQLEKLNEQWELARTAMGLPDREIGKSNVGTGDDYRRYYDTESVDMVRALYGRDIEVLGYTYE